MPARSAPLSSKISAQDSPSATGLRFTGRPGITKLLDREIQLLTPEAMAVVVPRQRPPLAATRCQKAVFTSTTELDPLDQKPYMAE